MSKLSSLFRIIAVQSLLLLSLFTVSAQETLAGDPAADDFITASLLIADPGPAAYQAFGHAAIRMQCPSADLDYVFTFETDMNGGIIGQFIGGAHGRMTAVSPDAYFDDFVSVDRGVAAYRLNLTPKQKQELWRVLDQMLLRDEGSFSIRHKSCSSQAIRAVNDAVFPETIVSVDTEIINSINGVYSDSLLKRHSPWSNLFFKVGFGSACEIVDPLIQQASPIAIAREHDRLFIASADSKSQRPLFVGQPVTLVRSARLDSPQPVTPMMIGWSIIAICLIASVMQWFHRCRWFVVSIDVMLMAIVTILGGIILFVTYMPHHIGGLWNWNLILFSPVPLIVWVLFHRRSFYRFIDASFAVVALLFAVMSQIFLAGIDQAIALFAVGVAIRCAFRFLDSLRYR